MYAQEGLFWVELTFNQKSLFLVLKLPKVVASCDLSAKRESSNSNKKYMYLLFVLFNLYANAQFSVNYRLIFYRW